MIFKKIIIKINKFNNNRVWLDKNINNVYIQLFSQTILLEPTFTLIFKLFVIILKYNLYIEDLL